MATRSRRIKRPRQIELEISVSTEPIQQQTNGTHAAKRVRIVSRDVWGTLLPLVWDYVGNDIGPFHERWTTDEKRSVREFVERWTQPIRSGQIPTDDLLEEDVGIEKPTNDTKGKKSWSSTRLVDHACISEAQSADLVFELKLVSLERYLVSPKCCARYLPDTWHSSQHCHLTFHDWWTQPETQFPTLWLEQRTRLTDFQMGLGIASVRQNQVFCRRQLSSSFLSSVVQTWNRGRAIGYVHRSLKWMIRYQRAVQCDDFALVRRWLLVNRWLSPEDLPRAVSGQQQPEQDDGDHGYSSDECPSDEDEANDEKAAADEKWSRSSTSMITEWIECGIARATPNPESPDLTDRNPVLQWLTTLCRLRDNAPLLLRLLERHAERLDRWAQHDRSDERHPLAYHACDWMLSVPLSFWTQHPHLIDVLCRRFYLGDWSECRRSVPLDLCRWLFARFRRQLSDLPAVASPPHDIKHRLQQNLDLLLQSAPLSFLVDQLRDDTFPVASAVWNHWITRPDLPLSFFESYRNRINALDSIELMLRKGPWVVELIVQPRTQALVHRLFLEWNTSGSE